METVFIVMLMLVAVIGGNVLSRHWQQVPAPFFLIGLGILFSFIPFYSGYTFSPSVFGFAVIGPLLYNEAQNVSRYWVGRGMINIFSLAIVLVVLTVLVVGAGLHLIFPVFPLALAFALCAIVTPTDASAVSAMATDSPDYQIPRTILQNESLFNDASGIVAFDLALATFVSGTFSAKHAFGEFGLEFFGGLLLGTILGLLVAEIRRCLIRWGDDTPVIMVTLEILTPFLMYYLADVIGFSGILAVVAAGLIQGGERDRLRLTSSRMQIVSANVWEIISGILSGIVFVLLGISLPGVIIAVLSSTPDLWWQLILAGVFVYALKFVLRLVWSRYFVWMHEKSPHRWRDSLLMALSGANGTITLSLAFSMPTTINGQPFAMRIPIIFTAAVIIMMSLIMPTFLIPVVLDEQEDPEHHQPIWLRRMLQAAISRVREDKDHPAEAQIVVDAFSQQLTMEKTTNRKDQRQLFNLADEAERQVADQRLADQQMTQQEHEDYLNFLNLSRFTFDQRLWKNLGLRIWFAFNMGTMYHDVQKAQDTFMTSPLIMEQMYWQREFERHDGDIRPMETAGFKAAMAALKAAETRDNQAAMNVVRRYYRERHRRMNLPNPDPDVVYSLFLAAFHAEYDLVQESLSKGDIPKELAQRLQQRINFDETSYIQNSAAYIN